MGGDRSPLLFLTTYEGNMTATTTRPTTVKRPARKIAPKTTVKKTLEDVMVPRGISTSTKVKKTVPYAKFIFRFVQNPSKTLHFNYENTQLGYTDGNTYFAPIEVCNHLDSLKRKRYELKKEADDMPATKVQVGEDPRCYCQILETFDKEMD
jgi:hypothetical protein